MPETVKTMDREETQKYVLSRIVIIVTLITLLTGVVVFVSQYFQTNNRLDSEARERTVKIAQEVKATVLEYPAHDWLILYWQKHAKDLDIEYDVDFKTGTETEKKVRLLAERHPDLQLRYATEKEIKKLSEKDQKLYAEVAYSWLITRLDQIKRTYKMAFLYGALEREPFNRQFFLFSAADEGAVRGTEFNQVYTLGVDVEISEIQQNAMKQAASTGEHIAMQGNFVDYYSFLTKVGDQTLLVGLTYDLSAFLDNITAETISGTMIAMMYQILLGALLLIFTWLFVIRPLMEQFIRATADKERISAELSLATEIQASMLPHVFPPFPDRKEIDLYASMDPAREVGGDFYDFFLIDVDHLGIVIADVSGKGVPAALFMMESKIILENNAAPGRSPAEILAMTNETICANNTMEMFVSVWLGILELSTGKLRAANAGHEYPVITNEEGEFELLKDKHGLVIGAMEGMRFRNYEVQLAPGTKLFVYTDGVPEATDANDELFGNERMVEALNIAKDAPPQEILRRVRMEVDEFVGEAEQFDDLTMLCLEYKGADMEKNELLIDAKVDNLPQVLDYVNEYLENHDCSPRTVIQVGVVVEEIFVNIASYAYGPEGGSAGILANITGDPAVLILTFRDQGMPYNPLEKEDPDITLSAEEREIGGLGIFMTKQMMDDVAYEYKDGQNILTLTKNL